MLYVISPFPTLSSPCALQFTSPKLLRENKLFFSPPCSIKRENKQISTYLSSARPRHLQRLPSQFTLGQALMICFSAETQQNTDVSSAPRSLPTVPAQLTAGYKGAAQATNTKLKFVVMGFWNHLNSSGFELIPKDKDLRKKFLH